MAKDVDLSSQEWRDIVFENKNKEFGAYELRGESPKRHTKALVLTVIIVGSLLVLGILATAGILFKDAEEDMATTTEQELTAINNAEEEQEEEEEQIDIPEPEEPEPVVEEIEEVAQQQFTEVIVKKDEEVTQQIVDQSKLQEDTRDISTINVEGEADLRAAITSEVRTTVVEPEKPKPVEENKVYDLANVEQKPSFKGGDAALFKWLSEHVNYPAAAAEDGASGTVQVQFVVSKTGQVTKVKIVRGKHPALDKEAMRVVKEMPAWNPGRQNGQPVDVSYILPVKFTLK